MAVLALSTMASTVTHEVLPGVAVGLEEVLHALGEVNSR
jgi:hypothetical protein